jgi:hypothetical protein
VSPGERILTADLAAAIAPAGVDPALEGQDLQVALILAITDRRGSVDWTVDHAGWVVMPLYPKAPTSYGHTVSEGLAWSG